MRCKERFKVYPYKKIRGFTVFELLISLFVLLLILSSILLISSFSSQLHDNDHIGDRIEDIAKRCRMESKLNGCPIDLWIVKSGTVLQASNNYSSLFYKENVSTSNLSWSTYKLPVGMYFSKGNSILINDGVDINVEIDDIFLEKKIIQPARLMTFLPDGSAIPGEKTYLVRDKFYARCVVESVFGGLKIKFSKEAADET